MAVGKVRKRARGGGEELSLQGRLRKSWGSAGGPGQGIPCHCLI